MNAMHPAHLGGGHRKLALPAPATPVSGSSMHGTAAPKHLPHSSVTALETHQCVSAEACAAGSARGSPRAQPKDMCVRIWARPMGRHWGWGEGMRQGYGGWGRSMGGEKGDICTTCVIL